MTATLDNPISDFEKWERSSRLQLELLETLGDVEKKRAEAAVLKAKAGNVAERNKTIAWVNKRLAATLKALDRQQYKFAEEQKRIRQQARHVALLKHCRSDSTTHIALAWSSLAWFIGQVRATALVAVYEADQTLAHRMAALREANQLPEPGSADHLSLLRLLAAVDDSRAAQVEALESWRMKIHAEAEADLGPLKDILGVAKE